MDAEAVEAEALAPMKVTKSKRESRSTKMTTEVKLCDCTVVPVCAGLTAAKKANSPSPASTSKVCETIHAIDVIVTKR